MSSNITVTISDPNTILVPNTGTITPTDIGNITVASFGVIAIIVLLCTLSYALCHQKSHYTFSKGKNQMKLHLSKRTFISFFSVFSLVIIAAGIFVSQNSNQSESASAATSEPNSLTIETEDINLDVKLDGKTAFGSVVNNIKITSSTSHGYTLGVYASGTDIVSKDNKNDVISGLPTSSSPTALNKNTWGISTVLPDDETSTVWRTMPVSQDEMLTIKTTSQATPENDTVKAYYGVLITDELPYGTYVGPTINYVAIANTASTGEIIEQTWNDFNEPGSAYKVSLNSLTGDFTYTVTSYCSMPECSPTTFTNTGTVPADLLSQIISLRNQIDFTGGGLFSAAGQWFQAISFLIHPNEYISVNCNQANNTQCEEYDNILKDYDSNHDGKLTYLEYSHYLLFKHIPDLLAANTEETIEQTWSDMAIPGAEYEVSLNSLTGDFTYTVTSYCSALDCEPTTNYTHTGTVPTDLLNQVISLRNQIDFTEGGLFSAAGEWFGVFSLLLDPSEYILEGCSQANSAHCEEYDTLNDYDINHDGNITHLEYSHYLLFKHIPNLLQEASN